jgi:hypothetical protein
LPNKSGLRRTSGKITTGKVHNLARRRHARPPPPPAQHRTAQHSLSCHVTRITLLHHLPHVTPHASLPPVNMTHQYISPPHHATPHHNHKQTPPRHHATPAHQHTSTLAHHHTRIPAHQKFSKPAICTTPHHTPTHHDAPSPPTRPPPLCRYSSTYDDLDGGPAADLLGFTAMRRELLSQVRVAPC